MCLLPVAINIRCAVTGEIAISAWVYGCNCGSCALSHPHHGTPFTILISQ